MDKLLRAGLEYRLGPLDVPKQSHVRLGIHTGRHRRRIVLGPTLATDRCVSIHAAAARHYTQFQRVSIHHG